MLKHYFAPFLLLAALGAAPATQPATTPAGEFVVAGQVTDDSGAPLANVTVYARCGTEENLIRTGTTRTDKSGKYRLAFGPGVGHERGLGHPVVGFQTANIIVLKNGYFEKNLGRQGDLAMTDDPQHTADRNYAGVVLIHQPYHLDFVLSKGAAIEGRMLDPDGKPRSGVTLYLTGPQLPPLAVFLAGSKTDDDGKFHFRDVPTNYPWSFVVRDRDYASDITAPDPFTLTTPATFTTTVTSDPVKHTLVATPIAASP